MKKYKIEQSEDFYEHNYVVKGEDYSFEQYCGIWNSDFEESPRGINKIIDEFNYHYYKQIDSYSFFEIKDTLHMGSLPEFLESPKSGLSEEEKYKESTKFIYNVINAKIFKDCPVVEEVSHCKAITIDRLVTEDTSCFGEIRLVKKSADTVRLFADLEIYNFSRKTNQLFENVVWFRKIARELKHKVESDPQNLGVWVAGHLKIDPVFKGISKVRPKDLFQGTASVSPETAQQIHKDLTRVFGVEDVEVSRYAAEIEEVKHVYERNGISDELAFMVFAANRYGLGEKDSLALLATLDSLVKSKDTSTAPATTLQSVNAFLEESPKDEETSNIEFLVEALKRAYRDKTAMAVDIQVEDSKKQNWKSTAWKEVCKKLADLYQQPVASVNSLKDCIGIKVARKDGIIVLRITIDGTDEAFRQLYRKIK